MTLAALSLAAFVPDRNTLVDYTLACLVLFATPGPDMTFVISQTVVHGRVAGFAAVFGGAIGCCIHTLLAAYGVSILLSSSSTAFSLLKLAGAFYLLLLAIDTLRKGSALGQTGPVAGNGSSVLRVFLLGLGVNVTNPKVMLFFLTFLPQFVTIDDPTAYLKVIFMGLYFVFLVLPLCVPLVCGAERLSLILKERPRVARLADLAFACVFGAFAGRILISFWT